MEYEGWEIVKMISEDTIKDGTEITAHFPHGGIDNIIIKFDDFGHAYFVKKHNIDIRCGLTWLFKPKSVIYFTIQ